MNEFTCTCGWQYIIGKKKVYGPIWHQPSHGELMLCGKGRMMSREVFEDDYADCAYEYNHKRK